MVNLPPEVEQQLGALSNDEWSTLTAKLRAPDSTEQLRTVAGQVLSGAALESFMAVADVSKFTDDKGAIAEEAVMGRLTALFGVADERGPTHADFGQYRAAPPEPGPGDRGKAEAARRFGPRGADTQPHPTRGAGGLAEAQKRFGKRQT
jgi:hypothetical protein